MFVDKNNLLQQVVFCRHFCFEENFYQRQKTNFVIKSPYKNVLE